MKTCEVYVASTEADLRSLLKWLNGRGYKWVGCSSMNHGTSLRQMLRKIEIGDPDKVQAIRLDSDKMICRKGERNYYDSGRFTREWGMEADIREWKNGRARGGKGGNANMMARRMFASPNQVKTSFRKR